jgi:hypothetical protein
MLQRDVPLAAFCAAGHFAQHVLPAVRPHLMMNGAMVTARSGQNGAIGSAFFVR